MVFRGADRRLRTRYKVRIPFTLRSDGEEVHGFTRNVSLLGISAYSAAPVPLVQAVRCILNIPGIPRPLTAHGTVIRCEALPEPHPDGPHEVGVFFKDFEGQGEAELSRYLCQLLKEEQSAIRAGYRVLQQRALARKRRKRQEALLRRQRKLRRLRRRLRRLKREALLRRQKRSRRGRPRSRRGRPAAARRRTKSA